LCLNIRVETKIFVFAFSQNYFAKIDFQKYIFKKTVAKFFEKPISFNQNYISWQTIDGIFTIKK
jgi:hypothetical protein